MYTSFYGLEEKPFNLNPDPTYLFWSSGHENAYTHLEYAITENKGFGVITGEVGSGKTTLINYLIHKIPQDLHVALINNPDVTPIQLLKMLCQEYELDVNTDDDKTALLEHIYQFLLQIYANQQRALLIIDEAQNLPAETIEEIRMLSNLETEKEHLIQIILVGQPELKEKLQRRSLRQFTQRVTVHTHLGGLTVDDVDRYIRHRLKVAGADNLELFTEKAIQALHTSSNGIPRLINILCDTALVYGFADELKSIDLPVIENVMADRKSGGILLEEQQNNLMESQGATTESKVEKSSDAYSGTDMEKRLRSLEHQVRLLETIINNMEQQLYYLGHHRSEQDKLMVEMLQLLKENVSSRVKITARFYQLQEQLIREPKGQPSTPSPSFFSRLRKRK